MAFASQVINSNQNVDVPGSKYTMNPIYEYESMVCISEWTFLIEIIRGFNLSDDKCELHEQYFYAESKLVFLAKNWQSLWNSPRIRQ